MEARFRNSIVTVHRTVGAVIKNTAFGLVSKNLMPNNNTTKIINKTKKLVVFSCAFLLGTLNLSAQHLNITNQDTWNNFVVIAEGHTGGQGWTFTLMVDVGVGDTTHPNYIKPVTKPIEGEFLGTFNGGGKTVTLAIRGNYSNAGLFMQVGNATVEATIKNFTTVGFVTSTEVSSTVGSVAGTVTNATISGVTNQAAITGGADSYVGGVAGTVTNATIWGAKNQAAITGGGGSYIGGIAGEVSNADGVGIFINCENHGVLNAYGEARVGGIMGISQFVNNSRPGTRLLHFSQCKNFSEIWGCYEAGGIAGQAWAREVYFDSCFNYNDIFAEHHIGGIAACVRADVVKIVACENYNSIVGTCNIIINSSIGGIVGYIEASKILLEECSNYGNIVYNLGDAGGIAGKIKEFGSTPPSIRIISCLNNGSVVINDIKGYETAIAGGIIGYCDVPTGSYSNFPYDIINCKNSGSVECNGGLATAGVIGKITGRPFVSGNTNIGRVFGRKSQYSAGVVGWIEGGLLESNVNSGIVDGAIGYAGGIAGYLDNIVSIEYCINTNWIEPVDTAGAIVGGYRISPYNAIFSCFYDNQMSIVGGISGVDIQGRVEGLNTDEMTGRNLQLHLQGNWTFQNNLYPRTNSHPIGLLSAAPIYLHNSENVSDVKTAPFELSCINNANHPFLWGKYDAVTEPITDTDDLQHIATSTNGNINVLSIDKADIVDKGWDILSVRLLYATNGSMPSQPNSFTLQPPNALVFEKAVPLNPECYTIKVTVDGYSYGYECLDISPSGNVNISSGKDTTFYISTSFCCFIKGVYVDGKLVPESQYVTEFTYTFKDIQANHTFHIVFGSYPRGDVFVYRNNPIGNLSPPDYRYEKTNADIVEFKVIMPSYLFLALLPLPTSADFVLAGGNGTIIDIVRDTDNFRVFYVTIVTDTNKLGDTLGINKISDIVRIDSVLGIPVDFCYSEYYDVRKKFFTKPFLIEPMNNSTVSINHGTGIIGFDEPVEFNTNYYTYPNFPTGLVSIWGGQNFINLYSSFDDTFDNNLITFSFGTLQQNANYSVYLNNLSPLQSPWVGHWVGLLIDEWGNHNVGLPNGITLGNLGSFQTSFYKIGAENDASTTSSSGGFTISNIYPNPTTNEAEFTVNVLEEGSLNVAIYDLSGSFVMQIISDKFMNANTELRVPLTLGMLSSGTYTVVVSMSNNKSAKQVIIVK